MDKETYIVLFTEKFNRAGEYWKSYASMQFYSVSPSGKTNLNLGSTSFCVDDKAHHGTGVINIEYPADPLSYFLHLPASIIGPQIFNEANLLQFTK
jgi:hypothetical protein